MAEVEFNINSRTVGQVLFDKMGIKSPNKKTAKKMQVAGFLLKFQS